MTLDAEMPQRGEVWFAKLDEQSAFLVDEARFMRELRIHRIRLQPFKRDQHGKIVAPGSLTMVVPCKWQCPKCGQFKEHVSLTQLKRLQGAPQPYCNTCSESTGSKVLLTRMPVPVKRVDPTNPEHVGMAKKLYAMFKAGAANGETPNLVPRIWTSFRVEDAPPPEAWIPAQDDVEAFKLDAVLRDMAAVRAKLHGTIVMIEPRGKAQGSGHRVWIAPNDCNMAAVRSPVAGMLLDLVPAEGKVLAAIRPDADPAADPAEPPPECVVVEIADAPSMDILPVQSHVDFGTPLATPKTWVPHEVDGAATVVINEQDVVDVDERIAEGFTLRPVKVAMDLGMGGVQKIFLAATQDSLGQTAPRFGWLSWEALTGALSDDLGYTFYAAKDHVAKPRRREGATRLAQP